MEEEGKCINEREGGGSDYKVQFFIQVHTCCSARTPYLPEVLQRGGADREGDEEGGFGGREGDRRGGGGECASIDGMIWRRETEKKWRF